jgi:hypothetical protein
MANTVAEDLDRWFEDNYRFREQWDKEEFSPFSSSERFGVFLRTTLKDEWKTGEPCYGAVELNLSADRFADEYNFIVISTTIFNITKQLNDPNQRSLMNEIPKLLANISEPLIRELSPTYCAITHDEYMSTYGHDVLNAKLDFIHWFNCFGSRYFDRYGKEVFLNTPAWRVEEINGQVIIQLASDFFPAIDVEFVPDQLLNHYKNVGVKRITWP